MALPFSRRVQKLWTVHSYYALHRRLTYPRSREVSTHQPTASSSTTLTSRFIHSTCHLRRHRLHRLHRRLHHHPSNPRCHHPRRHHHHNRRHIQETRVPFWRQRQAWSVLSSAQMACAFPSHRTAMETRATAAPIVEIDSSARLTSQSCARSRRLGRVAEAPSTAAPTLGRGLHAILA